MQTFESIFLIGTGHPALPGHFPGAPVVPGVLLLDRVIETLEGALGRVPASLRLPQAKFLEPLLPGQVARIELHIDIAAASARFSIRRADRLLASGNLGWQVAA